MEQPFITWEGEFILLKMAIFYVNYFQGSENGFHALHIIFENKYIIGHSHHVSMWIQCLPGWPKD